MLEKLTGLGSRIFLDFFFSLELGAFLLNFEENF